MRALHIYILFLVRFIDVSCFLLDLQSENAIAKVHKWNLFARPIVRTEKVLKPSSRQLAFQALMETAKNKNLNPVTRLENSDNFLRADQRDRSFARNLVSTTSRRLGQIDAVLSKCCDTYPPAGKFSELVLACLRLGAVQLLFLNTPSFAAVKETIDELKNARSGAPIPEPIVKFCNAVLRRVDREGEQMLSETSPVQNLSAFLYNGLIKAYGKENTNIIIQQFMDDSSHSNVDLSLKMFGLKEEEQKKMIDEVCEAFKNSDHEFESITLLPNNSIRVVKGPNTGKVSDWPLYNEGMWWVQDVSSTLPAIALISAIRKQYAFIEGLHVVDCCAAPGGKTSQLLSAGFEVTAIESSSKRSRRLKENLSRLNLDCTVVISPGQSWIPDQSSKPLVGVLIDSPCTASGTGNKNPDALRRDDFGNLIETQELLANHFALNILKPGAIMIYSTCSLHPEESELQVQKLIKNGFMKTLPFEKGEIPGFDGAIDENGWLRILPGVLEGNLKQCDGFFVSRMVKL